LGPWGCSYFLGPGVEDTTEQGPAVAAGTPWLEQAGVLLGSLYFFPLKKDLEGWKVWRLEKVCCDV